MNLLEEQSKLRICRINQKTNECCWYYFISQDTTSGRKKASDQRRTKLGTSLQHKSYDINAELE